MRNKTVIQFTGSKVTHMPHPFNDETLCGRGNTTTPWEGGYYETFPEITCKGCQKAVPAGLWGTATTPYRYGFGDDPMVFSTVYTPMSFREIMKGFGGEVTWLPSADNDPSGILVLWDSYFKMWTVWTY